MNELQPRSKGGALLSGLLVFAVSAAAGAGAYLALFGGDEPASQVQPLVTAPVAYVAKDEPADAPKAENAARGASVQEALVSAADVRRFRALERKLNGKVGVAVTPLGEGPIKSIGALRRGVAWSTMKVPVLVTLIRDRDGVDGLSSQEKAWARAAVTRSDNDAAKALFAQLEKAHGGLIGASDELESTLRAAGDERTEVNTKQPPGGFTTFGQTSWTAGESARFYRQLARGCLMEKAGNKYVLGLMGDVVADQRWGMGRVDVDDAKVALKGGWGPGTGGYLVRQSAVIGAGRRGYAISILARAGDGSFASGISLVDAVARWAARDLDARYLAPHAECE